MEKFVYIARDLAGQERQGLKQGLSRHEVYAWLRDHGLVPVEVRPVGSSVSSRTGGLGRRRVKYTEMSAFCWQLATMVEGGVLITEAIETIAEDIRNPTLRYTLMEVGERIKQGESFSGSVSNFPRVFNRLFCAMIVAGETSGSLPTILTKAG